jgi:RimK family alpha-L-glutamate ligase
VQKTGWLIVNEFLHGVKYDELYAMLKTAAKKRGVLLCMKTNAELMHEVGGRLDGPLPDFAIFWDKDVYLCRSLERLGVRTFNSARAIENCDNKIRTAELLTGAGICIPRTFVAPKTFENVGHNSTDFLQKAVKELGLPMVIKEAYGSFGEQVYLAKTYGEVFSIVERIGHKDFLMQQFIASSKGRDIRVNVVGDKVVAAMLRENKNDFRSNVSGGGIPKKTMITKAQEQAAISASQAMGLDFAGVDVLFGTDGEPIICEVNSNPHFKSTYQSTGVDMSEHILDYILARV